MAKYPRTFRALLGSCATATFFVVLPAAAQQALMTKHVQSSVALGLMSFVNSAPAAQTMKLSIVLPLRNRPELRTLLDQLSNPQSPSYRKFLSVQDFTARFGPTAQDYDTVRAFALASNLKITAEPANRMLVDVKGTVADVQRAFHVNINLYRNPNDKSTFYAPDREPTTDLAFPLWRIAGLDNLSRPRPLLRKAQPSQIRPLSTTTPAGSAPDGSFLGSDIRAAYYGGSALTGSGQSIGLYGLFYNLSDVQNYFNSVGQPFNPAVVQNYSTDGTVNSCNGCDDGEPVIDIEQALSMAPGVDAVIEYFGANDYTTFNAMASDNRAKQLSVSYGYLPADPATDDPIFQEFAAQGQSLFVASGDSGAYDPVHNPAFFPWDDPYVTTVGGTDLTTNGAGGSWMSEAAWSASGGGISTNGLAIPEYQQSPDVINTANGGSTTLRNVPDVAAEANTDNWFCANGSCEGGVGGTSLSTPRWAGFMALVNQQAVQNGVASVGFLNPIIYSIGASSAYVSDFHDITSGNNGTNYAGFLAVSGYDLVTGWGSPNGQNLINALTSSPPPPLNLNGTFTLNPQNAPGLVLDDWFSGTRAGNPVDIWPANGTGAQSWVLSSAGVAPLGAYNIAVSYGAYCLTATGSSRGSLVELEPCAGLASQAWLAAPSGAGYSFNPASNTTLCLGVQANRPDTLAQVQTCNGGKNEQWVLN